MSRADHKSQILELSETVNDVISAANYIAGQSSLNASERFLDAVKKAYQKIAEMSGIGTLRDYEWPELLMLRVLHGSPNIDEIFRASGN